MTTFQTVNHLRQQAIPLTVTCSENREMWSGNWQQIARLFSMAA